MPLALSVRAIDANVASPLPEHLHPVLPNATENPEWHCFSFCFEYSLYSVSSDIREDVIDSAKSAFKAAYENDGSQPAMSFFEQVRVLDPGNIVDCDRNFDSINSIP